MAGKNGAAKFMGEPVGNLARASRLERSSAGAPDYLDVPLVLLMF